MVVRKLSSEKREMRRMPEVPADSFSQLSSLPTPSEVFSALVNVDANGAGMSWIGTRSDGSQKSGYTFSGGPAITELTCGANCVIAWLNSGNAERRTVTLKQNANTTSIKRKYVINIWY